LNGAEDDIKTDLIEKELVKTMEEFEIIDSHEHINPEKVRIQQDVDIFTLFSHYERLDLLLAGMKPDEYEMLFNRNIPLERRWSTFSPFWKRIQWGSYAKAVKLAIFRFYGFESINDGNFEAITQAVKDFNKEGLYERVLANACKIRAVLNQCDSLEYSDKFSSESDKPHIIPVMQLMFPVNNYNALLESPIGAGNCINTVDDYLGCLDIYIKRMKALGVTGMKIRAEPCEHPSRNAAIELFRQLKADPGKTLPEPLWPDYIGQTHQLRQYIFDEAVRMAVANDMVIAVHTGYWGDFRNLNPMNMIPVLQRYPQGRFDIYHAGFPFVREALMLGKGFPGVWLNYCWTHIISQNFARQALDEALDLIPVNKIIAFGGDYITPVENIYGHLVMARENIAYVLAKRIKEGIMTEGQAVDIARMWFWDNPKQLYNIKV
jgi:uncharacterized protein